MVGTLSDEDQKKAQCDNRVLVHGQLTTQAISEISKKCRLGLSSFALHRNSMNEACTLKTREYLMSGLAVYSGHKDVFPDDFSYYRFGLPNIDSILQFYKEISAVSMMSISKESEKYISKRVVLADLNRWICDQIESK